ncbi:MAG: excinuclease ABC subunit A [Candidatus Spechtbacteria bacterium RIFCSPHIGHO2_02_FULL_43_15b]|uniref:UvrABC system protein A n=1 Tax=Candidatus Spechtbacteria bacterium RIFCSPHIGHO2_01_FULL_43_30 TaxID=1802158 RepID=A0A1G2H6U9_9BACT|nr:MAG: excinuclease ABC subunit A [Candidatus Spechtbacteria bacterium RIFCSPHIGHO2_01_FULL_43_30]OGZ60453.1 MAG: excinuclease ABC subunit A [Candidatus Spechtbacteria bacterium RIFCSPHIGHO2_02_FULL_43_15b]
MKGGDFITIKGAKVHNLKNISLKIPKNKLVVITGLSGSGKSSLAFDTIFAEGQRRYVESLSAYARQFLGVMQKPDVDDISGISPAISIDQKNVSSNPRSTVGTVTEIYDYLRLLFARGGTPYCPNCDIEIKKQTISAIADELSKLKGEFLIFGPVIRGKKGEHRAVIQTAADHGFSRVRVDGNITGIDEALGLDLDPKKSHAIDIIVDRINGDEEIDRVRLVDSIEMAMRLGKGLIAVSKAETADFTVAENSKFGNSAHIRDLVFSENFACAKCGFSLPEIQPRTFSFNSPYGACQKCSGLGTETDVDADLVIPNKNLTISEGAVKPWMSASHKVGRQGYFWHLLREMSDKYEFSLDEPVRNLDKDKLKLVLYGDEELEGVVPSLIRRYKETDSDWTRAEIEKYMVIKPCSECAGRRLNKGALGVRFAGYNIHEIANMSISNLKSQISDLQLKSKDLKIVEPITKEIKNRLQFLVDVGLHYLTLARSADTLSGGEAQRLRLATQIGSKLSGVIYILDEPSIGLHPRDQARLIKTLKDLRDLGNSVIVVEHDSQTILEADWLIDIGPGAGKKGGEVVFEGTSRELLHSDGLTGKYLSGRLKISKSADFARTSNGRQTEDAKQIQKRKIKTVKHLTIKGACEHNLKNIDVKIPLGKLVCVTGVSGSGKSSLVNDILAKSLRRDFSGAHTIPGKHEKIEGLEFLDKALVIDQGPIGRTPRSNPATYTGAFNVIRDLFASTREAKARGYMPGRFSFNVKGGRCEQCEGQGVKKVEMFFLPDVYVECDECHGTRYTKEVLDIGYNGKNIAQILSMTVEESFKFFKNIPQLSNKLDVLNKVGLSYLELGQPAPSLSGGEAQRIKLASELSRKATGKTLYILDEPTTGLHFEDINNLLKVLFELVFQGNSVVVVEHNIDVVKNADWIIDLGPEGGDGGGYIIAEGTPKEIAQNKKSWTGRYLE